MPWHWGTTLRLNRNKWSKRRQKSFNVEQCSVINPGKNNVNHACTVLTSDLAVTNKEELPLSVPKLKAQDKSRKPSSCWASPGTAFGTRTWAPLPVCETLVHPHVGRHVQFGCLQLKDKVELQGKNKEQKRATRMIKERDKLFYMERRKMLKLFCSLKSGSAETTSEQEPGSRRRKGRQADPGYE